MPKYPSYYVRPDGLHETILRINGKRKAFRGKTDKEVWEKVKAFDRAQLQAEIDAETTFSRIAEQWWDEAEPKLEPNSVKNYKPALRRAVEEFGARQVGREKRITIRHRPSACRAISRRRGARPPTKTRSPKSRHPRICPLACSQR